MSLSWPPLPVTLRSIRRQTATGLTPAALHSPTPQLFSGHCAGWPLTRELSARRLDLTKIAYLSELSGRQRIQFTYLPPAMAGDLGCAPNGRPNVPYLSHEATLSDFLQGIASCLRHADGSVAYAQSRPLRSFPRFAGMLGCDEVLGDLPEASRRLWLGSGGHVNNLHFDCFANFLFMIAGYKRVCLFPPDSFVELRPTPPRRGIGGATGSPVKLLRPQTKDMARLRRLARRGMYVVLRPGDALFIPPNWWHHVEGQRLNLMVNAWVHAIERPTLGSLEDGLQRTIRAMADMRPTVRISLRDVVRRACKGEPASQVLRQVPTDIAVVLAPILKSIVDLQLPSEWRSFAAAAADYYLFTASADSRQWAEIVSYAIERNAGERFISQEL
ncbi:cupin-like domain-containing protein [Rhizobacter sp. AJA081-3]|uniref:cupin-like domain-containing protein n=1 Tax=Rhizobacter sp. AJA081-3 TaxID=2753607 RepID=UPI001ADFB489|nr:cupin-like domain-containing protein [Rhizobacter sp. AJA081-3]QTN25680.1 cupin-like domain-containing protein [Rhizobacter sp. AJA081-3]